MSRVSRWVVAVGTVLLVLPLAPRLPGAASAGGTGGDAGELRAEGRRIPGPVWTERKAWLMGTWLRVRLSAPSRDAGFAAAGQAFQMVRDAESRWSSWREDTELSRLNSSEPGTVVRLPDGFLSVMVELRRWHRRTGGAFDPAVGALVDAWDLRGDGRRPSPAELEEARRATGLEHFRLDTAAGTAVRLDDDAWLDAGAFGKGLALRRVRDRLQRRGTGAALLDFGGQLTAWGGGPEGTGCWRVAVADPRERRRAEIPLRLCDSSASTTSASERFVVVDGEDRSHVLDPRSGRPAPAWGSVTVVHPDPMVADLLSTALFVMGPEEGLSWARAHDVAALFLRPDEGGLHRSSTPAMEMHLVDGTGPASAAGPFESIHDRMNPIHSIRRTIRCD